MDTNIEEQMMGYLSGVDLDICMLGEGSDKRYRTNPAGTYR